MYFTCRLCKQNHCLPSALHCHTPSWVSWDTYTYCLSMLLCLYEPFTPPPLHPTTATDSCLYIHLFPPCQHEMNTSFKMYTWGVGALESGCKTMFSEKPPLIGSLHVCDDGLTICMLCLGFVICSLTHIYH